MFYRLVLAPEFTNWRAFTYANIRDALIRIHAPNGMGSFTDAIPYTFINQNQRNNLIVLHHPSTYAEAQKGTVI